VLQNRHSRNRLPVLQGRAVVSVAATGDTCVRVAGGCDETATRAGRAWKGCRGLRSVRRPGGSKQRRARQDPARASRAGRSWRPLARAGDDRRRSPRDRQPARRRRARGARRRPTPARAPRRVPPRSPPAPASTKVERARRGAQPDYADALATRRVGHQPCPILAANACRWRVVMVFISCVLGRSDTSGPIVHPRAAALDVQKLEIARSEAFGRQRRRDTGHEYRDCPEATGYVVTAAQDAGAAGSGVRTGARAVAAPRRRPDLGRRDALR